jgi:hypothetical protein
MDPMQDIFSVSASNESTDSTDAHSTPVTLVYMEHEQARPSWLVLVYVLPSGNM